MWTIEGQEVIVLGDVTTHGGQVLTASKTVFYMGRPVAHVGDQVSCPRCKGVHTIISGAPKAYDQNREIARNGDEVSCGARLISSSNKASFYNANRFVAPPIKEKKKTFTYVPHTKEIKARKLAMINTGSSPPIAATYTIRATITVEGQKLTLFAYGWTGLLMQHNPPEITFSAEATIEKSGKEIAKQFLIAIHA